MRGQTAVAGFQVGVQETVPIDRERLWRFLLSPAGLQIWLGGGLEGLDLAVGAAYRAQDGTSGEVRSVAPGERLRLTWQPVYWENRSTLQLYLRANGDKTALRFHHEKLAGAAQRGGMKAHWQAVLDKIHAVTKDQSVY